MNRTAAPIELEIVVGKLELRPLGTGAPNTTTVTVVATQAGVPVKYVPIELTVKPLANSGGHDHHDASRPRGTVSSASGVTGADGRFTTTYTASEIAGMEEIIAGSPQATQEVKARIAVKVEGLGAFSGPGNYLLTGRTASHPDNHYIASQAALDDLRRAADEFAKAKWNTTGKMRLNDMSLEWGGLFDIDNNWKAPHSLHRVGRSVDIENLVMETIDTVDQSTGKAIKLTVPKVKFVRDFQDFMENKMKSWKFKDEGQTRSDVFKRTRKYPHFEWEGK